MIKCKCKQCGKAIEKTKSDFNKTLNHFCSSSCSATYYNTKKPKRKKKNTANCKNCSKGFYRAPKTRSEFCSIKCRQSYKFNNGLYSSNSADLIKMHLKNIYGNKCSICGIAAIWMAKELVLVLDHIDGNSQNNMPNNLRLVCPNCDSQLPTYKFKNVGNGRHNRKMRYQNNKSY